MAVASTASRSRRAARALRRSRKARTTKSSRTKAANMETTSSAVMRSPLSDRSCDSRAHGQAHDEAAAVPDLARHVDAAAVRLHDSPADRQAEPGAARAF